MDWPISWTKVKDSFGSIKYDDLLDKPLKLTGGFKIDMANAEPALNGVYLRAYDYMEPSYFTGADILIETSIGVKKLCIIDPRYV